MKEHRHEDANSELGAVNVPMTGEPEGQEPGLQSRAVTENSSGEERVRQIAEAAYRRAELRGFNPGYELDDWLAAEREFDANAADEP